MQIDGIMRGKDEKEGKESNSNNKKKKEKMEVQDDSSSMSGDLNITGKAKEQHKRVKNIQKTLKISYEEARKIDQITVNKGLQGKMDIESEDEEFLIDPKITTVIEKARGYLGSMIAD